MARLWPSIHKSFESGKSCKGVKMWSSRNKMLLDADGDGEDDVAFLSG